MNVPKYLWPDVVLTASYFINMMPPAVLARAIPLRRLCPDHRVFHLPHWVFGCICFVQDLSPSLDKLSPCLIKCVFVGYFRT